MILPRKLARWAAIGLALTWGTVGHTYEWLDTDSDGWSDTLMMPEYIVWASNGDVVELPPMEVHHANPVTGEDEFALETANAGPSGNGRGGAKPARARKTAAPAVNPADPSTCKAATCRSVAQGGRAWQDTSSFRPGGPGIARFSLTPAIPVRYPSTASIGLRVVGEKRGLSPHNVAGETR